MSSTSPLNADSQELQDGKQNGSATPTANGTSEKAPSLSEPEEKSSPKIVKGKDLESPVQKTKEEANTSRSSTPMDGTPSIPDSPHSTKSSRSTNSVGGGSTSNGPTSLEEGMLNLNMSASEMRQMLANRRKKDPKKEPMDIRQKYEIIQQM